MNKKAQGEIITTVLIILLVLAAVVIVWQAVKTTTTTAAGKIQTGAECIGLDLTIDEIVCDISDDTVKVTVSRAGDSVAATTLTVTATDATGVSHSNTGVLDTLGTVQVSFTAAQMVNGVGTETSVNTGIKNADGTIACQGAKAIHSCQA